MSIATHKFDEHKANLAYPILDPGNGGSVTVNRSTAFWNIINAGTETRTLNRPTATGDFLTIGVRSATGVTTLTVTGGYDTAGDTALLFTAAGQFAQFVSGFDGTNYYWRLMDMTNGSIAGVLNRPQIITALSTVGAGTITAAGVVGGITNRTGSTSAFTDTTDTAALIIAALPAGTQVGASWKWTYYNNTIAAATLAGGVGVTLTGTGVPAATWAEYLVTYTGAGAVSMVQIEMGPTVALPYSKITTGTAAVLNAGDASGAAVVHYINNASNATVTFRTATQMFADIPNCQIGLTYTLLVRNLNATGLTLTAPDGNTTLSGTMTVAQNVTRTLAVQFTSPTAMTITSMGISAAAV